MKLLSMLAAILALGFTLATADAQATGKRLGGGQSSGMQRQAPSGDKSPSAAPSQAGKPAAPAAAQQTPPKRSWMGPLAGLAAGLGLAALASHFGLGGELASMMIFGLIALAVMLAIGFVMRRRALAKAGPLAGGAMQYAAANAGAGPAGSSPSNGGLLNRAPYDVQTPGSSSIGSGLTPVAGALAAATTGSSGNIPADFDSAGFARNAKVNFIRLQAANDAGDMDDIRNFTTPEMFAELKMQLGERGTAKQVTEVVSLNADVIDVAEEESRYVVSVRFSGVLREQSESASEGIDEVWHMVKPRDGKTGWTLAGIQQTQ